AMFEQARNPIVAVTDDDCVPDAAWIESVADALQRSPLPDAVCGRVLALPQDGPRIHRVPFRAGACARAWARQRDAPRIHGVSLRVATAPADFAREAIPWRVGTGA